MKRFLAVLAILALAACIPVDDFGVYRTKTNIDQNLLGDWQEVPNSSTNNGNSVIHRLTAKNGAYISTCLTCKSDKRKESFPETLRVGKYWFFVDLDEKGTGGVLTRYKITNDELISYSLNDDTAWNFIEEKYPDQKNIIMEDFSPRSLLVKGLSDPELNRLQIKLFDDEVYEILSHIPDNEIYWHIETRSLRIGSPGKLEDREGKK